MASATETYRDATFSEATRNQLKEARDTIANVAKDVSPEAATALYADIEAIDDVIARWDANDATEMELPA